jgi:hypothetical protein
MELTDMVSWMRFLGFGGCTAISLIACGGSTGGAGSVGGADFGGAAGAGDAWNGSGGIGATGQSGAAGDRAGTAGRSSGGDAGAGGGTSSGGSAATGGAATGGWAGSNAGGAAGAWTIPPDSGSGACTDFTPCGGDVRGTWTIAEACFDPPLIGLKLFCSDAQESMTITGTVTLRADGSVGTDLALVTHDVLSAQCAASLGGCGTSTTPTCVTASNGTCICDSTQAGTNPADTWRVEQNVIVFSYADGHQEAAYFCQVGDQLMFRGVTLEGRTFVYTLRR